METGRKWLPEACETVNEVSQELGIVGRKVKALETDLEEFGAPSTIGKMLAID